MAPPSSLAVQQRFQRQASKNTQIELRLRSLLHRRGLRFRVHRRPIRGVLRTADVLFAGVRVAVYVDGCFWHGCPDHLIWPKANSEYWREKITTNRRRDADTDAGLASDGWEVLRVWEHDDLDHAADRIEAVVSSRRGRWA